MALCQLRKPAAAPGLTRGPASFLFHAEAQRKKGDAEESRRRRRLRVISLPFPPSSFPRRRESSDKQNRRTATTALRHLDSRLRGNDEARGKHLDKTNHIGYTPRHRSGGGKRPSRSSPFGAYALRTAPARSVRQVRCGFNEGRKAQTHRANPAVTQGQTGHPRAHSKARKP
jgi:hypothetical protein